MTAWPPHLYYNTAYNETKNISFLYLCCSESHNKHHKHHKTFNSLWISTRSVSGPLTLTLLDPRCLSDLCLLLSSSNSNFRCRIWSWSSFFSSANFRSLTSAKTRHERGSDNKEKAWFQSISFLRIQKPFPNLNTCTTSLLLCMYWAIPIFCNSNLMKI